MKLILPALAALFLASAASAQDTPPAPVPTPTTPPVPLTLPASVDEDVACMIVSASFANILGKGTTPTPQDERLKDAFNRSTLYFTGVASERYKGGGLGDRMVAANKYIVVGKIQAQLAINCLERSGKGMLAVAAASRDAVARSKP